MFKSIKGFLFFHGLSWVLKSAHVFARMFYDNLSEFFMSLFKDKNVA